MSISDKHKKIQIRGERAARDFFGKFTIFCESVMSLHRKYIVHTDLHQDNVMITQFENMEDLYIAEESDLIVWKMISFHYLLAYFILKILPKRVLKDFR